MDYRELHSAQVNLPPVIQTCARARSRWTRRAGQLERGRCPGRAGSAMRRVAIAQDVLGANEDQTQG